MKIYTNTSQRVKIFKPIFLGNSLTSVIYNISSLYYKTLFELIWLHLGLVNLPQQILFIIDLNGGTLF